MSQSERVLCIGSHHLEHLFKFHKITNHFLPSYLCPLWHIANLANSAEHGPLFLARSQCENDKRFRQLCSYIVINSGGDVFSYKRGSKGGEIRLHDLYSIGVGGHINDVDFDGDPVTAESLKKACLRELREEVRIEEDSHEGVFVYVGMILDTHGESVDAVHAGLVFEYRNIEDIKVFPKEECILSPEMSSVYDLARSEFERWSKILIDVMMERGTLQTYFH